MRIGVNHVPVHHSPEEWAEILFRKGYRAANFPVDYKAPVNLIDEYVKAAKKYDIQIAEVDLCQYFGHKKLKGYADFFNSSSSFCCGVI